MKERYSGLRKKEEVVRDNVFSFDMDKRQWKSLGNMNSELFFEGPLIETKNFFLTAVQLNYALIIDKKNLEFKDKVQLDYDLWPADHHDIEDHVLPTIIVRNDSIELLYPLEYKSIAIDLAALYEKSDQTPYPLIVQNSNAYRIWLWLLLPLSLIGLIAYFRKRNGKKSIDMFPYLPLLEYKGKEIDHDILDRCLGISDFISENAKRNQRSKILQLINVRYPSIVKITRKKSIEDKRVFVYDIE